MQVVAAGHYNGAGAGAAVAYGQRGGVVTRTGVGDYNITLDGNNAVDTTQGIVLASVTGAVQAAIRVAHTSDTVKQVLCETVGGAAAAVDADFSWVVIRYIG